MSWLKLLTARERLPSLATLTDTYAALLERLGPVSPFDLAVLGARRCPVPAWPSWWATRRRFGCCGPVRRPAWAPSAPPNSTACARLTCRPA